MARVLACPALSGALAGAHQRAGTLAGTLAAALERISAFGSFLVAPTGGCYLTEQWRVARLERPATRVARCVPYNRAPQERQASPSNTRRTRTNGKKVRSVIGRTKTHTIHIRVLCGVKLDHVVLEPAYEHLANFSVNSGYTPLKANPAHAKTVRHPASRITSGFLHNLHDLPTMQQEFGIQQLARKSGSKCLIT